MRKALPLLVAVCLVLLLPAPASAQEFQIKPGGQYTASITVKKPSALILYDEKWEIRVYFYDGTSCFSAGSWSDEFYTGWYQFRYMGDEWLTTPDTRSFTINSVIVSYPRPEVDITNGMREIPIGQSVTFRVRLLIKDIQAVFSGESAGLDSGYVTFKVSGINYTYQYTKDQYGQFHVTGNNFEAKIDTDSSGKWRLLIDKDTPVLVTEQAQSQNLFPVSMEINLSSSTAPEGSIELPGELKIALSITVVLAVVGAGTYLGLRKKGGELPIPEQ
ncbi:MAG: hypothetical protein AB1305_01785 [Candidatus Hadarchaeota archaeon]